MRLGDGEACHLESEAKPKFLAQIEANMVRWLCWGWLVTFMTNLKRKGLKKDEEYDNSLKNLVLIAISAILMMSK